MVRIWIRATWSKPRSSKVPKWKVRVKGKFRIGIKFPRKAKASQQARKVLNDIMKNALNNFILSIPKKKDRKAKKKK